MHWVLGIPKLEMSSQFFPYLYIDEDWVHPCPVPPRPWIHRPLVFCGEKPWKMPIPFNKATFFFRPGFKNEESYYLLLYPLVNVHITMERSTIFQWENSTISMAIFNSKLLVYQRVPNLGGITKITYYNHP